MINGRIYKKGSVVDLDEESAKDRYCLKRVESYKNNIDEEREARRVRRDKDGNEMPSKNGLRQKLEELRIPYKPRDSYETLLEKFRDATNNAD